MMTAVMLLTMSELVMAGDGEHVGCLVNWTPQAFQSTIQNEGYVWPTTGSFSSISTKDGHKISHYTASGELWVNDTSCGIGIICHEFSHCLGLPDIYPIFDDICITDITTQTDASMSFAFHTSGSEIHFLKAEPRATGVYTLSGQRLRDPRQAFTPLTRGVFIINGKKKIVK